MSAGQSVRRGYYGVSTTITSMPTSQPRSEHAGTAWVVIISSLIVVIAAIASDQAIASSIARILAALWTDGTALLREALSRHL